MNELGIAVLFMIALAGVGIMAMEYRRLWDSRERLYDQIERQRATITKQERELRQWRHEYGELSGYSAWWQQEETDERTTTL